MTGVARFDQVYVVKTSSTGQSVLIPVSARQR